MSFATSGLRPLRVSRNRFGVAADRVRCIDVQPIRGRRWPDFMIGLSRPTNEIARSAPSEGRINRGGSAPMTDLTGIALLKTLIGEHRMDEEQTWTAIKVLANGVDSLNDRDAAIYNAVLHRYLAPLCVSCGFVIAGSEVRLSWDNGGYCSYCAEMQFPTKAGP
jgi:hypothetical protein